MEPFRHVTVLNVDLSRKFFTRQRLHINNFGEERIAIKIANVFTTALQKNENGISVSGVSYKNDAITQETLKLVEINQEASANATTHEKSADEVNRTVENDTQSGNLIKTTSQHLKMLHTSRRHKNPPVTNRRFFIVDNNQILNKLSKDIYSLVIFHHMS